MLVSTNTLFKSCYGQYAVAAVNVFTMEQVIGVFSAASKYKSPIIIQTTPVARNYANPQMLINMVKAAAAIYPDTVYALHLDHGYESHIDSAIESAEYSSVMIDASHEDFDENIKRTREVVKKAKGYGIAVEAELGVLSGVEDDTVVEENKAYYTQPEEVELFVKETGCDSLAIAIGTSHGAYKFSGNQGLQLNILKKIQQNLPGFPLVLHGGSSVDPEEISRINLAGGNLQSNAKGVSGADIKEGISLGICKINLATDLRILWTRVHREFFNENPTLFDPIIPGKQYMSELEILLENKFSLLNSIDKASEVGVKTSIN